MSERINDVVEAVRWWQGEYAGGEVTAADVAETMHLSFYTVQPLLDDAVARGVLSITEYGNVRGYSLRDGTARS